MSKGTPSMGLRNKRPHIVCRRCGRRSYHARHKICSACGFGRSARLRSYAWKTKKPLRPTH
ncbi:MAG: 50S ribosomal protein L37e [Methanocalculus sp. MSAO_Arc2]|uniref:50S ribosomal protein L37e n=1 Tax=Methanocalculus sp. MSAO_Arc2 TaxID=2293855 RepID=UPI000FF6DA65|nr:MAG: 50S ribosomal protein L37e [Methanocalculus sp. MSAO_Arc2]